MLTELAKTTTAAIARRGRGAMVVLPLLAGVMNVQLDESPRRGLFARQLHDAPLQVTGIAAVRVAGSPTLVFDHSKDKQEPNHIPDLALSAWKEVDGTVNLTVPHFQNYRMRGPDLEHLTSAPERVFSSTASAWDSAESNYNYRHWLSAPYTFDGRTIYALSHHEWYACLTADDCSGVESPTPTSTGNYQLNSWVNAVTALVSSDGGASWRLNGRDGQHVVTNERFLWSGSPALEGHIYRQALNQGGMMSPSRIIREGNYYYSIAFLLRRDFSSIDPETRQAAAQQEGWVLMRTADPTRGSDWEAWVSGDEYVPLQSQAYTVFRPTDTAAQPQLIYDTNARAYLALFTPLTGVGPVYYVTTPTLASPSWSAAAAVDGSAGLQINPRAPDPLASCSVGFRAGNYVSLLDTHSAGMNFEFTDGDPWLFYTYNPGAGCGGHNLDRDIVRVRLSVVYR